jgi:hypothetical protein
MHYISLDDSYTLQQQQQRQPTTTMGRKRCDVNAFSREREATTMKEGKILILLFSFLLYWIDITIYSVCILNFALARSLSLSLPCVDLNVE